MFAEDRGRRAAELAELFDTAPIKKTFGMELAYEEGRAVFTLPHNRDLEHALGDTHGGIIATLIDNAGWFTAAAHYATWIATIEMQVRLHLPAGRQKLRATGTLVRAGKSFAVTEMRVENADGDLVATGSGTFAVTSVPFGIGEARTERTP